MLSQFCFITNLDNTTDHISFEGIYYFEPLCEGILAIFINIILIKMPFKKKNYFFSFFFPHPHMHKTFL